MFRPLRNLFRPSDPAHKPRRGLAQWIDRHVARISYAVLVEPTWLEVNRLEIPVCTECAGRGLRIVQLSDFHFQRRVPVKYVERCVEAANAEEPDLIALTGDYVHKGHRYVEGIAELLSGLSAPLGVYAVLGNHDHAVRNALGFRRYPKLHQRIVDALIQRGIRVLHNELLTVELDGLRYQISGVDDLWSRRCRPDVALADLDPGLPHVMLAHHPRTIELLDGRRCDLMLSGHTHGGQVHTQRFGSVTLGKRMKRYAAGLYSHGESRLYVNKGVGFGLQIRYNRRPEIAVFDLVPKLPDS
ncbi:MAG TPA: metallophosphoesterase [Planctomycetaceae bacterium]|nr:metallophosphoesterase [Planctomycetaceae bacterium]